MIQLHINMKVECNNCGRQMECYSQNHHGYQFHCSKCNAEIWIQFLGEDDE